MEVIKNKTFCKERELYNLNNITIDSCTFAGDEDGESPLKECSNLEVVNCSFSLRYGLWHNTNLFLKDCKFDELARTPLWYGKELMISHCEIGGTKALRESNKISIDNCNIISDEFCWKCKNIELKNSIIESSYGFFESKNIVISEMIFKGKYSFQYTNDIQISDSKFDTKDAFWHAKNIRIKNCEINGEYIGWYSKNLVFENCKISGTQPFCYCQNLCLINCDLSGCDLAFEYSEVKADIYGDVASIKNPTKGIIKYQECKEIILNNSKYKNKCLIIKK